MTTTITTNNEPRISSLEIAELTGKPHNDVMKAIRKMEPAWVNVQEGKFSLSSYSYNLPNGAKKEVACYSLTKTESLYIATKFNDEARAKLVLRWYQLEQQEHDRQQQSQLQMMQVLSMQNQVLEKLTTSVSVISQQVNELRPLAQLGALAKSAPNCIYIGDMAKLLTQHGYKIGQNQLFQLLRDKGYLFKYSNRPMQEYVEQGLFQLKETFFTRGDGRQQAAFTTMVTAKGQEYFLSLFLPSLI